MIKMPTFARILNALYFEECFTILDACVSVIKPGTVLVATEIRPPSGAFAF